MCVRAYVARQLGVGLQSGPNLRLKAAVGENLGDEPEFTGLNRRQLLIEQQHLTGLEGAGLTVYIPTHTHTHLQ